MTLSTHSLLPGLREARRRYEAGECEDVVIAIDLIWPRVGGNRLAAKKLFREAIGGHAIRDWADALGRTKLEKIAAFDRAIAIAEQEAREAVR